MKIFHLNDTRFWQGKDARDNWNIIKDSEQTWAWFHLEKFPSSHVIICKNMDEITKEEIQYAADLVCNATKYKFKDIGVQFCEVENLTLGSDVGSVIFKSNRKVKKIKFQRDEATSKI